MKHDFDGDGAAIQAIDFDAVRSPDQDAATPVEHPVVIVGAGPVGLTLAIDLAQRGQRVVLLDNDHKLSTGSRAICFAKRTLEVWDRLGVGDRMCAKGVSWQVGKVFFREQPVYRFDLLGEPGHERPAFINLQQYYAEAFLVERALQLPQIDLRWLHAVSGVEAHADGATLAVDTPDGPYRLRAQYVVACDGSRSAVRRLMGMESRGRTFKDRFLIVDVRMGAPSPSPGRPKAAERPPGGQRGGEAASVGANGFPAERWFWFDPPFHPRQSVLLHMQPDGVWRIDFQLGWDADPEAEKQPERIVPRVRALLGADARFELEWASVYTFSCQRMDRFVHGRVIFAGDAAHGVSPFGARGANSGVQDADNLGWKLDRVLRGGAGDALIASYGIEREAAADENILNSTRSTDFITPKSAVSRLFRDATLELARDHAFARRIVNSGRLSVPTVLHASPLNTPDEDCFDGGVVPGAAAPDAPLRIDGADTWLLRRLDGRRFTLLCHGDAPGWALDLPLAVLALDERHDVDGHLARRYDLRPGTAVLFRPDQHVCARWRAPAAAKVSDALRRATAC